MTLLSALNDVQRLTSLPVTAAIVGNSEESQQLLLALARQAAQAMVRKKVWPVLQGEHVFASTAAALQVGGLPTGYDRMVKASFWNRTTRRRVMGPVTTEAWQRLNSSPGANAGVQYFRAMRGGLYVYPTPTAGQSMAYDYVSKYAIEDSVGADKESFTADTDVYLFGDQALKLDVRWRYLQEKGLEYAEALKDFEVWAESEFNTQEGAPDVALSGFCDEAAFGLPNFPDGDYDDGV